MAEPKPNPTPKEEFLANAKLARQHLANIEQPELRAALAAALAEYARRLADTPGGDAHPNHYKLVGAHDFLDIFYKLSFPKFSAKTADRGQLNYNA